MKKDMKPKKKKSKVMEHADEKQDMTLIKKMVKKKDLKK